VAIALTCRVEVSDESLHDAVTTVARLTDRPVRPLHLQALLQLPRLADHDGAILIDLARSQVLDLAQELPPSPDWAIRHPPSSPRNLEFEEVEVSKVQDGMERFHYLRSARLDGRAYTLSTSKGELSAFCVSSPLDVDRLARLLASAGYSTGVEARVVSRVFAFQWAPRNTISRLLALAGQAERRLGIVDLVTYVNPNMGFTGSSYLASGWSLLGKEPGTRYRYLDSRYTTDRALAAAFGQQTDDGYRRLLGQRFSMSVMPLAPLLVFHRRLG